MASERRGRGFAGKKRRNMKDSLSRNNFSKITEIVVVVVKKKLWNKFILLGI